MFEPKFFLGIVTDNEDPDKRGRVRVRVMGIHTELTQPMDNVGLGIAEKDLPLAQCMYPVTYTGTGGTCPPPSLLPGDWVLGVSLDGNAYQNLMVLGLAKAKFNAESLADGSINAEDAFSTREKPTNDTGMKEMDSVAKDMVENRMKAGKIDVTNSDGSVTTVPVSAKTLESNISSLSGMSDSYETAKQTAADFVSGDATSATISTTPDKSVLPESISVEELSTKATASGGFIESAFNGVKTALTPEWAALGYTTAANGNTIPFNTNAFDTALSDGFAVYNIVKFIKDSRPSHYNNFVKNSDLDINTDGTPNNILIETLGEGYYEYCYNYFNGDTNEKSHILPTFAYSMGVGETEDYTTWYGNPMDKRCSYARMILNMRNDGLDTEADFMASIVRTMNKKYNTKIVIVDKNAKNYNNHQYLEPNNILDKKFRGLGTVVMPTLRSTVSQAYIVLPEYSIENDYGHEHFGIDLVSAKIPVVSMADGVVKRIYDVNPEDCNGVVIQHACNVKTLYMHMSPVKVREGDRVKAGQIIGTANGYGEDGANTTTTHLHFEVKYDTKLIDPLDFLKNKLGFYIKEMSTINMYKRDALSPTSDLYKKIKSEYRTSKNIAWSF